MISDKGEDMYRERTFNNLMGMLFRPVDLPVFKRFIMSEISYGAVGKVILSYLFCLKRSSS